MSNVYRPHIIVIPEDDANRQIVNGFLLSPSLNIRAIDVQPPAGGWKKVVDQFNKDCLPTLHKYPERRVLLIVDCDGHKDRIERIVENIPEKFCNRVFVLGVLSEPERMKHQIGGINTFEDIGEALANDCSDETTTIWDHELLRHNSAQVQLLSDEVKPFLFNQ